MRKAGACPRRDDNEGQLRGAMYMSEEYRQDSVFKHATLVERSTSLKGIRSEGFIKG